MQPEFKRSSRKNGRALFHASNRHLRALKLQGMSDKTIDAYSRAVRRISTWFDCCPDRLEPEQLADNFSELVESSFWSTVKLNRCGMHFFYRLVLNRDW